MGCIQLQGRAIYMMVVGKESEYLNIYSGPRFLAEYLLKFLVEKSLLTDKFDHQLGGLKAMWSIRSKLGENWLQDFVHQHYGKMDGKTAKHVRNDIETKNTKQKQLFVCYTPVN